MASVKQELDMLRDKIANIITNLEIWDTLGDVQKALGLPPENPEGLGKYKYLHKVAEAASDEIIINAAKQTLVSYPGTRGKPSISDLEEIQDALWWIENQGIQGISNVIRYEIAEALEGIRFWGRLSLRQLLDPVFPSALGKYSFPETTDDGRLYTRSLNSDIFSSVFAPQTPQAKPIQISVTDFLCNLGLTSWRDQRFCLFLERIVSPEAHPFNEQQQVVAQLNELLQREAFELRPENYQGGVPLYKTRKKEPHTVGTPKYIIFASHGVKPDIVIDDAINMNIRVVRHAEQCLIYDQPPTNNDLTWQMLVDWWSDLRNLDNNSPETRRKLGRRLQESIQSEPERFLFDAYFKAFKPKLKDNLPALLPQVYLHYDPRFLKERSEPVLFRQRIDFLMILRNAVRVIIEIDGIHHYAEENGKASPARYAKMVVEDRRIKNLGYEVYRFGGAEFINLDHTYDVIVAFFEGLFARYEIRPKP